MGSTPHEVRTPEVARASRWTTAAPEEIWARWVDPASWHEWVENCREVELETPLRCSSHGRRRLASGTYERFVITTFVPHRTYVETVKLLGARLISRRDVVCQQDGSEISVAVSLHGRLAWLYRRRLVDRLSASLPAELDRLTELAEYRATVSAKPPLLEAEDVTIEPPVPSTGA